MSEGTEKYGSIRILVIEDEEFTRQMIVKLLRQLGFRLIHEAADGEAGYKELIRVRPEVVLCDIHMQPLDGMGFLAKLRALSNPHFAKTPLLFLTADKQQDTVMNARKLQVDGYVVKPVALGVLQQRLDAVLKKHNMID